MNDGGPAFPWGDDNLGMSLRAWLAGQAIAGFDISVMVPSETLIAARAVKIADATLKALQEES